MLGDAGSLCAGWSHTVRVTPRPQADRGRPQERPSGRGSVRAASDGDAGRAVGGGREHCVDTHHRKARNYNHPLMPGIVLLKCRGVK